ncbi:subunit IIA of the PTS sugar transporter [Clostridium sporogenes]|uniref:PTS sugar transporter subunit IIA n=1 Tax=Clostridium botulinum TaxID=1491 RepID=UPI000717953D|nr:PTS glucose transporter subunit IIA [Clostridium botulinum]KRU25096.1 subunit IIA of the PTS sugar transporter [Clostridium sporogenes]KRU31987.1 subunit IIA of the PTS sugar transporter [Clostridium sporogenes]KRU34257.1 subunit IIA of the PTS sugar transporter [Clostridium sporogenes]KRU41274.1 subunit IIA of the PTS sugar transporter [Clostridium sporogenes]MBZ1328144.1 PTS glucose transporter subunit IIA [Clostridium botulinum]
MFSLFKKKEKNLKLKAYLSGKAISINKVPDEVFASKIMGDGLAIIPTTNIVKSPADGEIIVVMEESKHAVGIKFENGIEALIHVGIDTVSMNGEGFEIFVKTGDSVKEGQDLIMFDEELIKNRGLSTYTMLVITNSSEYPNMVIETEKEVKEKESVIITF